MWRRNEKRQTFSAFSSWIYLILILWLFSFSDHIPKGTPKKKHERSEPDFLKSKSKAIMEKAEEEKNVFSGVVRDREWLQDGESNDMTTMKWERRRWMACKRHRIMLGNYSWFALKKWWWKSWGRMRYERRVSQVQYTNSLTCVQRLLTFASASFHVSRLHRLLCMNVIDMHRNWKIINMMFIIILRCVLVIPRWRKYSYHELILLLSLFCFSVAKLVFAISELW